VSMPVVAFPTPRTHQLTIFVPQEFRVYEPLSI
jgi:hypothetical protein